MFVGERERVQDESHKKRKVEGDPDTKKNKKGLKNGEEMCKTRRKLVAVEDQEGAGGKMRMRETQFHYGKKKGCERGY